MPLHVKAWSARMFCSGGMIYLPFDQDFKPERPEFDNHMPLSKVGNKTSWYIFVEFPPLDPQDASYPHYVELHDNEDFTTFKFEATLVGESRIAERLWSGAYGCRQAPCSTCCTQPRSEAAPVSKWGLLHRHRIMRLHREISDSSSKHGTISLGRSAPHPS